MHKSPVQPNFFVSSHFDEEQILYRTAYRSWSKHSNAISVPVMSRWDSLRPSQDDTKNRFKEERKGEGRTRPRSGDNNNPNDNFISMNTAWSSTTTTKRNQYHHHQRRNPRSDRNSQKPFLQHHSNEEQKSQQNQCNIREKNDKSSSSPSRINNNTSWNSNRILRLSRPAKTSLNSAKTKRDAEEEEIDHITLRIRDLKSTLLEQQLVQLSKKEDSLFIPSPSTTIELQEVLKEVQQINTSNETTNSQICGVLMDMLNMIMIIKRQNSIRNINQNDNDDEKSLETSILLKLKEKLVHADDQGMRIVISTEDTTNTIEVFTSRYLQKSIVRTKGNRSDDVCSSPTHHSLLISLAILVKIQVNVLPPEKTAQSVVMSIFLPYLEQQLLLSANEKERLLTESDVDCTKRICHALVALLQNRQHASSILSPLVEDVRVLDGKEIESNNPIRTILLETITQLLDRTSQMEHDLTSKLVMSIVLAQVVTSAVDAIRSLNQPSTSLVIEGNAIVVNVKACVLSTVIRPVTSKIESDVRGGTFCMIQSILKCYPSSMTSIGWKMVVEDYLEYLPVFFGALSNEYQPASNLSTLPIEVLTDFVLTLPWKRWLPEDSKRPKKVLSSGLSRTVISAVEALLVRVRGEFESGNFGNGTSSSFERLCTGLFLELPCRDDRIKTASVRLWRTLAASISDPTSSQDQFRIATGCMVRSSGGFSLPNGNTVEMSEAGRSWFLDHRAESNAFVENLISLIVSGGPRWESLVEVLIASFFTLPDVAILHWASLENMLQRLVVSKDENQQVACLKILDATMSGRKRLLKPEESVLNTVRDILIKIESREDNCSNQKNRCLLSIYHSFCSEDWLHLTPDCHFDRMLAFCQHSNASLRELACKALGEFSTQFFGTSVTPINDVDSKEKGIAQDICTQMLRSCTDRNAGVRAMSMFAMGNLVAAIRVSKRYHLLGEKYLRDVVLKGIELVHNGSDKVTGNSIRLLGHAGEVLLKSKGHSSKDLLLPLILTLSEKLSKAVSVSLNQTDRKALTWKQRSSARKHGWGACFSLGLLFRSLDGINDISDAILQQFSGAIQSLIVCLEYHDVVHAKLVSAVVDAMSHFPYHLLMLLTTKDCVMGRAVTRTIMFLFQSSNSEHYKLEREQSDAVRSVNTELLLCHLLNSSTLSDVEYTLSEEMISATALKHLYLWMVERDDETLHPSVFENFAIGLSNNPRWSDQVSLEQAFSSRANKMQVNSSKWQCSSYIEDKCHEEDEL